VAVVPMDQTLEENHKEHHQEVLAEEVTAML
jgi:hypothetical protein